MSIKRNNRLLLWLAILPTFGQLFISTALPHWGLYIVVPYLICFAIGLIFIKKENLKFFEVLPFNVGIKPVTALLIVAMVFLFLPLSTALGELGQTIGGDMLGIFAAQFAAEEKPFIEQLFETAVVPAIFEELWFRGFFYQGFKKARGARFAIIMTSLLFGFFHMNVQQIMYAAALGVVLAIIREATGSMWAGCLYHFVNNGWSCVFMKLQQIFPEGSWIEKLPLERVHFIAESGKTLSAGTLVYSTVMLIICTGLGIWALVTIVKREGRLEDLKKFFKRDDDPKEKVVTAPFIFAWLIYLFITLIISVGMALLA